MPAFRPSPGRCRNRRFIAVLAVAVMVAAATACDAPDRLTAPRTAPPTLRATLSTTWDPEALYSFVDFWHTCEVWGPDHPTWDAGCAAGPGIVTTYLSGFYPDSLFNAWDSHYTATRFHRPQYYASRGLPTPPTTEPIHLAFAPAVAMVQVKVDFYDWVYGDSAAWDFTIVAHETGGATLAIPVRPRCDRSAGVRGCGNIPDVASERGITEVEIIPRGPAHIAFSIRVYKLKQTTARFAVQCSSPSDTSIATRGEELTCSAGTGPGTQIYQAHWLFTPDSARFAAVSWDSPTGEAWVGPLVTSGWVSVSAFTTVADIGPDDTKRKRDSVHVDVRPRAWAADHFGAPKTPNDEGQGPLSLEPVKGVMTFGGFLLRPPAMRAGSITRGPNQGYGFVLTADTLPRPAVYINRALDGDGFWAKRQVGRVGKNTSGPRGYPYCTAAAFAPLKRETERHEGIGGAANSHYGIAVRELASSTMLRDIEQIVLQGATNLQVGNAAFAKWDHWKDSVKAGPQKAFDDAEYEKIPQWSGNCEFDYTTPEPSPSRP